MNLICHKTEELDRIVVVILTVLSLSVEKKIIVNIQ